MILRKVRLALLEYKEEFTEVPNFAQKLRAMCTNHFQNKRAVARRPPAEQASINRRHRRRSRKEKVSDIIDEKYFYELQKIYNIVNTPN